MIGIEAAAAVVNSANTPLASPHIKDFWRQTRRPPGHPNLRLQNEDGQIATTHSISAGLGLSRHRPEHAWLADQRRADTPRLRSTALDAARLLSRPKASSPRSNPRRPSPVLSSVSPIEEGRLVILNLSGRGDKDMDTYSPALIFTGFQSSVVSSQ